MIPVREILRHARVNVLGDVDAEDVKFKDVVLIDALNDAIQFGLKLLPILRWTDTHTFSEPYEFKVNSVDDTVLFPPDFEEALVIGTCGNVCGSALADAELRKRAVELDQRFIQLMKL